MKVLIAEDNISLSQTISSVLTEEGFICEVAPDFHQAGEKIHMYDYDAVIVDINLPGGSGLTLIRTVKSKNMQCGIIVISARNSLDNKIEGLDLGADDYLTKPFDVAELVARLRSVIRRRSFNGQTLLKSGDITIDVVLKVAYVNNVNIRLTKSEYDILLFFFSNQKRVLTRQSIAEHIMGDNMDMADSFDFIYSHIKNIRKKIKAAGSESPIKVVYGIGYKFSTLHP